MDINAANLKDLLENSTDRVVAQVASISSILKDVKWKTVSFIIDMEPSPSHRPRLSGYRVYVPGAAKNMVYFNKHVLPKLNGLFITTPCKIDLGIYVRTPKSFSKTQTALAEMRLLRPWVNTGDNDNFEKAVYDMMQPNEKRGFVGIMDNDCLIIDNNTHKYYSIHPRYEVSISYMEQLPAELYKILRLKGEDNDADFC